MEYLDFEEPIKDLIEKLNQTIKLGEEGDVDVTPTLIELENKINNKRIGTTIVIGQKCKNSNMCFLVCFFICSSLFIL